MTAVESKALSVSYSLIETEAYEWLLTKLRSEVLLVSPGLNIIEVTRQQITDHIWMSRNKEDFMSKMHSKVVFSMDWDILRFLKEQKYSSEHSDSVERVITITGNCDDGQALTLAQYLTQTWPSTGAIILEMVKNVIAIGTDYMKMRKLFNNITKYQVKSLIFFFFLPDDVLGVTTLIASIRQQKFKLEVNSDISFIVEAGEVLSWIGAALRTSPYNERLVYCSPGLTWLDTSNCSIGFVIEEIPQQIVPSNGQCWHRMFKNAVIVKGFPIRRKSEVRAGLEIPINIMAGLVRTKRIEQFHGRYFIKGFSAMLVPTKRSGDTIIWHHVFKQDGNYISYLDTSGAGYEHLKIIDVETSRHVVGWCIEAKIHAGGLDDRRQEQLMSLGIRFR